VFCAKVAVVSEATDARSVTLRLEIVVFNLHFAVYSAVDL